MLGEHPIIPANNKNKIDNVKFFYINLLEALYNTP